MSVLPGVIGAIVLVGLTLQAVDHLIRAIRRRRNSHV